MRRRGVVGDCLPGAMDPYPASARTLLVGAATFRANNHPAGAAGLSPVHDRWQ
jgi:hypothetical protein